MTHTHQPPASMESLKQPFAPSENATLGGTCRNCKRLRAALDQKHAEYEDLKRCAANNTRNQGLKIETLLRGINDARALIDPIWRHRMGAEQVREHVQRGLRCIDSAITDCQFTAPTAVHASDCAMHNAPAYPAGECDCGALGPNARLNGQP